VRKVLFSVLLVLVSSAPSFSQVYIVKKGDSLYKIAKKFHTTVRKLKRENHLRGSFIRPGQRLYIPTRFHSVEWYRRFRPKKSLQTIAFIERNAESERETVSREIYPITDVVYEEAEELSSALSTPVNVNYDNWSLSILNDPNYKETLLKRLTQIFKEIKNTPYVFGGMNPRFGLDCSSFTMYVYKKLGIKLPRTAREQFNVGVPVSKEELKPGDLVFFRTYASYPSHVGIYIGNGKFVHFSSMFHGLAISSLNDRYFRKRFIGAKRILSERKIRKIIYAVKEKTK